MTILQFARMCDVISSKSFFLELYRKISSNSTTNTTIFIPEKYDFREKKVDQISCSLCLKKLIFDEILYCFHEIYENQR